MDVYYVEGGVEDFDAYLDRNINLSMNHSFGTILLEPSKALTMMLLGLRVKPSQSKRSKSFFGSTFREEPVSTKTWARVVPLH